MNTSKINVGLCLIVMALFLSHDLFSQKYKNKAPKGDYNLYSVHDMVSIPEDDSLWMNNKAKNIILMIGDGMGVGHITAGMVANKGKLNLFLFPFSGYSRTYSADNLITDSAAGGTAISSGSKTNNGMVGMTPDSIPVTSILEIAERQGKSTGLVATSKITDATPASFIAHASSRYLQERIASDFLKTDIDFFVGGGRSYFEDRMDGVNLLNTLESRGYEVIDDIYKLSISSSDKIAGLLYKQDPPNIMHGRADMLTISTMKALEVLSKNEKGFFLMVEGSQIDWGGHSNNPMYVAEEMLDFDRAIGIVLEFASNNKETLVIVTADHETGGMSVTEGDVKTGEFIAGFLSKDHTANVVPVYSFGPGAMDFSGFYENTEIFKKMMRAFDLQTIQKNYSGAAN